MNWAEDLHYLGVIATAGGLGAIIGLEREISDKPAGLRTHILVAAGSALLMLLGQAIVEGFRHESSMVDADPIRVLQAIVIGISFLGAGTIIHQGANRVEGLTTAASIYVTAGVGVATAVEHVVLAAGTAVLAVGVLAFMGWVERRLRGE